MSVLVGQTARHAADAARARAEAEALAGAAARLSAERDPLAAMLAHLRLTFGQEGAALFTADADGAWTLDAGDGDPVPSGRRGRRDLRDR